MQRASACGAHAACAAQPYLHAPQAFAAGGKLSSFSLSIRSRLARAQALPPLRLRVLTESFLREGILGS